MLPNVMNYAVAFGFFKLVRTSTISAINLSLSYMSGRVFISLMSSPLSLFVPSLIPSLLSPSLVNSSLRCSFFFSLTLLLLFPPMFSTGQLRHVLPTARNPFTTFLSRQIESNLRSIFCWNDAWRNSVWLVSVYNAQNHLHHL